MRGIVHSIFWVFFVSFFLPSSVLAGDSAIDLTLEDQTLSARIEEASLRAVIQEIKEETGVWVKLWLKGKEGALDERVSVRFKDLPVQQAFERIFSSMNHSLIFDGQHNLLGVFLLGTPDRSRTSITRRPPIRYRRR